MSKCDFNKVALPLHWNHTSAWVWRRSSVFLANFGYISRLVLVFNFEQVISDFVRGISYMWYHLGKWNWFIELKGTLRQIWKSVNIFVFTWKYVQDFTLKQFLRFEICAREICYKFVYKHSKTIEYVEN